MNSSFSQTAILFALTILSLALACFLARYPRKTAAGVCLGVFAGFVLLTMSAAVIAFLGAVLPFGQIDFWLANLLSSSA